MKTLFASLRPALVLFVLLSIVTGLLYPLGFTGLAQLVFPFQANGSLVVRDGRVVGSALIGQSFAAPGQFWGRPSAATAASAPDQPIVSGGSNLGPSNPALLDAVKQRVAALHAADPDNRAPVPVDLVTASASGLDPHISRAAADYQLARVARARGWPQARVLALLDAHTRSAWWGGFGAPLVDVPALNRALDDAAAATDQAGAKMAE